MTKKERAFTLIELLIVIVVVITLAAIAIPNYAKSKQRALQKEAISNMKLIAAAERIYRMENDDYVPCVCSTAEECSGETGCNTLLKLMLNTTNWSYGARGSGAAIDITAVAKSGGCSYRLNSADFDSEDNYNASSGCI